MQQRHPVVWLMALFILAGCSTVQVSEDYDPAALRMPHDTWQWRDAVQPAVGDVRIDNPLLDKRIRRAVENNLVARGLRRTPSHPDIYLAYHLAIDPKIEGDTVYSSVGAGRYAYPWWHGGFGTEARVRQYDECRLTIDILAAGSGALIWRGVGTYRLRHPSDPQTAAEEMQQTVDKILGQFPPVSPS